MTEGFRLAARLLRSACGIALTLILAAPVLAAEAEAHEAAGWGVWETIGRFFNLFLLVGVLVYFVRKPLLDFFEGRRQEFRRQLTEGETRRQAAESKIREVEQRIANLEQEIAGIRREADLEMEAEARRVEQTSRQEGEKILAAASREIESMGKAAQKDLQRYAGSLSVGLAEEIIRREVGPADQERIVGTLVTQLGDKR